MQTIIITLNNGKKEEYVKAIANSIQSLINNEID